MENSGEDATTAAAVTAEPTPKKRVVVSAPIRQALSWGLIIMLGAVGGAINATLCYLKVPVAIIAEEFSWHIIPVGAGHGALLAVVAVGFAVLLWRRHWVLRWVGLPLAGWIAGWLSFIPIQWYVEDFKPGVILGSLVWPFQNPRIESLWVPYLYFGLVAVAYYFILGICRGFTVRQYGWHLLFGMLSGILGSLWWWGNWSSWHFSLLHGAIWGVLVGLGVWNLRRQQVFDLPMDPSQSPLAESSPL